jgi:hypothetical protein
VNKLRKTVLRQGGKLANSEENSTHVIDWNEDTDQNYHPPSINESFAKLIPNFTQISMADHNLVHWFGFPDSYNEFVPIQSSIEVDSSSMHFDFSQRKRFYLSCRFLLDCESFNEWPNELDYEITLLEEDESQQPVGHLDTYPAMSKGKTKGKRKSIPSSAQAKNLKELLVPQVLLSSEKLFPDILPRSLLTENSSTEGFEMELIQELPPVMMNSTDDVAELQKKRIQVSTNRKRTVRSSLELDVEKSDWFSLDSISTLERRYIPFLSSETTTGLELSYIQMRNSIINLYTFNRNQFLTATECRRKMSGDISKIIKIHEFLDSFGLINRDVKLESCPKHLQNAICHPPLKRKYMQESFVSNFPSLSLSSIASPETNVFPWIADLDQSLLSAVVNFKMDWKLIANNLNEISRKTGNLRENEFSNLVDGISAYRCMVRFIELTLPSPSTSEAIVTSPEVLGCGTLDTDAPLKIQNPKALMTVKQIVETAKALEVQLVRMNMNVNVSRCFTPPNSLIANSYRVQFFFGEKVVQTTSFCFKVLFQH